MLEIKLGIFFGVCYEPPQGGGMFINKKRPTPPDTCQHAPAWRDETPSVQRTMTVATVLSERCWISISCTQLSFMTLSTCFQGHPVANKRMQVTSSTTGGPAQGGRESSDGDWDYGRVSSSGEKVPSTHISLLVSIHTLAYLPD